MAKIKTIADYLKEDEERRRQDAASGSTSMQRQYDYRVQQKDPVVQSNQYLNQAGKALDYAGTVLDKGKTQWQPQEAYNIQRNSLVSSYFGGQNQMLKNVDAGMADNKPIKDVRAYSVDYIKALNDQQEYYKQYPNATAFDYRDYSVDQMREEVAKNQINPKPIQEKPAPKPEQSAPTLMRSPMHTDEQWAKEVDKLRNQQSQGGKLPEYGEHWGKLNNRPQDAIGYDPVDLNAKGKALQDWLEASTSQGMDQKAKRLEREQAVLKEDIKDNSRAHVDFLLEQQRNNKFDDKGNEQLIEAVKGNDQLIYEKGQESRRLRQEANLKRVDERYEELRKEVEPGSLEEMAIDEEYDYAKKQMEYRNSWNASSVPAQVINWVGDRVYKGGVGAAGKIYGLVDAFTDVFGIPRAKWSQNNKDEMERIQFNIAAQAQETGKALNIAGDVLSGAVDMVPYLVTVALTGGTSVATQAATELTAAGASFNAKVAQEAVGFLTDQRFIQSALNIFGSNYTHEKDVSGVSTEEAIIKSLWKGVIEGIIEVGGGIETAADRPNVAIEFLRTVHEEGMEEVQQDFTGAILDAAFSKKAPQDYKPEDFFSLTNQDAIINPGRSVEEYAMGAAVTALATGAQKGGTAAFNRMADIHQQSRMAKTAGANVIKNSETQTLVDFVADADLDPAITKQAQKLGEKPKPADLGRVIRSVNEYLTEQFHSAENQERAAEVLQKLQNFQSIVDGTLKEQRIQAENPQASTEELQDAREYVEAMKPNASEEELKTLIPERIEQQRQEVKDTRAVQNLPDDVLTDMETSAPENKTAYRTAFELGRYGMDTNKVMQVKGFDAIGEETAQRAFNFGRDAFQKSLPDMIRQAAETQKLMPEPGQGKVSYDTSVNKDALTSEQNSQIALVEHFAQVMGYNIKMYSSVANDAGVITAPNGSYNTNDGSFAIDTNAGKITETLNKILVPLAAAHEFTHHLKQTVPEMFREYSGWVLNTLTENGYDLNELIADKVNRAVNGDIDMDVAVEEVIAESSEMMLKDSQAMQQMAKQNPTLFEKVKDWLKTYIDRVRAAFDGIAPRHEESKALMAKNAQGVLVYAQTQQVMYDNMLAAEAAVRASMPTSEQVASDLSVAEQREGIRPESQTEAFARQGDRDAVKESPQTQTKEEQNKGTAYTKAGEAIDFHYELDDVNNPVVSHDAESFQENLSYPQEYQPKNREDVAHKEQVLEIERALNPYWLGQSYHVTTGAPIVNDKNVVESGNGRLMALRRLIKRGKGAEYTAWLKSAAASYGLDPADVTATTILKRVRDSVVDVKKFVDVANERDTMGYSAGENAKRDSDRLTTGLLEMARLEDGDIGSLANAEFVTNYIEDVVPSGDRNDMQTGDGKLSQAGIKRIGNALFHRAYGDIYLTEQMSESDDGTVKNMVKAMTAIAPRLAMINENMRKGLLNELSLGEEIAEAYRVVQRVRNTKLTVEDYVRQTKMQEDAPVQTMLLEMFVKHKNAPNKITDAIHSVLNTLERMGNPDQATLFSLDEAGYTPEAVVKKGLEDFDKEQNKPKFSERDTYRDIQAQINSVQVKIDKQLDQPNLSGMTVVARFQKIAELRASNPELDKLFNQRADLEYRSLYLDRNPAKVVVSEDTPEGKRVESAVEQFGITSNFSQAGYILQDGRMLNFGDPSGSQNMRTEDHRAISEVFKEKLPTQTDYLIKFMEEGNIRVMDEAPGVDLSANNSPTKEQLKTIEQHVDSSYGRDGYSVDFSDANGQVVGTYDYKRVPSAEKVLSDLDYFYRNGEVRETSDVQNFRYSDRDSQNNPLTPEQQDYFKDSKVRDGKGNLQVMYRGDSADFNEFDRSKTRSSNMLGRGFYFSDSDTHAKTYGKTRQFYLNLTNPIKPGEKNFTKPQVRKFIEAIASNEDYGIDNYGQNATVNSVLNSEYSNTKDDYNVILSLNASSIGDMVVAVELFNQVNKTNYDGIVNKMETVAFKPNQIKLIDSKNPTTSTDIRYSDRSADYLSPREILAKAFDDVAVNPAEKARLKDYKNLTGTLNTLEREASKLREQNTEQRRLKGDADKNLITANQNRIKIIESRINAADSKLIKMQNAAPLKGLVQREGKRVHAELMETKKAQIAGLYQRQGDSTKRGQIRKIWTRLNKLLTNPTPTQYIPAEYVRALVDVLQVVDVSGNSEAFKTKMATLQSMYEGLKTDKDFALSTAFDEGLLEKIKELQKNVGDTLPINMKGQQLDNLLEIVRAVDHQLVNARKMIKSNIAKDVYQAMEQAVTEIRSAKGIGYGKAAKNIFKYTTSMLDARRMARLLSGYQQDSMLEQLMGNLNDGQRESNAFIQQGEQYFDHLTDGKENNENLRNFTGRQAEWISTGVIDAQNNELKITPAMRTALYMHTLNDGNMRHLYGGGITMPIIELYKQGRFAEAYAAGKVFVPSPEQVANILSGMTDYDKAWAKAAQEFFKYTTDEINATSLDLVGYKKALVKNYFPILSDRNFLRADFESIKMDGSIEGMGYLKERVGSANPMYLMDITANLDRQIKNTAKYVGLAIPVRNFMKVYNATMKGQLKGVKGALNEVWQGNATPYIENLMTDLQMGRQTQGSFFDKAKGRFAQSVLALNPSVSLKQAASFPTAAAVVGWGPLMKSLVKGGKSGRVFSRADIELINKYTPILWMRTKGMSTTELGDIRAMKPEFGAASKLSELSHKYILNWIQQIDVATVGRLWSAAEYNIDESRTDLKKGTDEYYQAVARLFEQITEETQPNYSVMQRPDILRNPNAIVRGMTMFMTQRLQNFGILYDASGEFMEMNRQLKNDPTNQTLIQQRTKAGATFGRAVMSQTVSALVLAMMTLMGKALLHRPDEYRDEDNQLTAGSILTQVAYDLPTILFGMVVGGSEMYETSLSLLTGRKAYGLSFSPVEFINDLYSSSNKLLEEVHKTVVEGEDPQKMIDAAVKVAMQGLTFAGVPMQNAKKIVDGIFLHYQDFENGALGSLEAGKKGINKTTAYRNYVDAFTAGDKARMEILIKELELAGADEKKIETGIRAEIKSRYLSGEMDEKQAMKALGGTTSADQKERYRKVAEWGTEEGETNFTPFYTAIESGANLKRLTQDYLDPNKYGYDKSYLATTITNKYKSQYISLVKTNKSAAASLKSRLINALVLIGYERDKMNKKIDDWLK